VEIGGFIALIVVYLNLCRLVSCPLNIIFSYTKAHAVGCMLKKGQAGPMVNFELLLLHNMLSVTWDCANLGHVLQVSCPYQLSGLFGCRLWILATLPTGQ
jgi:hypothetical protein